MTAIQFEPIAHIHTCYPERFGTPRQPGLVKDSWGEVRLRPELNLETALDGIEAFSHLWLLFVFDRNANKTIKNKVHPPRLAGEKVGVFATRSPHRPNPIGLSVVKLEKRIPGGLLVSGIDLVDQTPILDIKPYLPSVEAISSASGGWTDHLDQQILTVEFSDEAEKQIAAAQRETRSHFRQLIHDTLSLDPRPTFYKGSTEHPNPYTDVYGFFLEGYNVVYQMQGQTARVLRIEPRQTT